MFSITTKMILNYYAFVNKCPPVPRSEDGSAGGGLGEECRAVRALVAPPHRPNAWRPEPSRNFPFLFRIFFRGRAQKKNCKGKFLRGCRRSDSGGGRRGGERTI